MPVKVMKQYVKYAEHGETKSCIELDIGRCRKHRPYQNNNEWDVQKDKHLKSNAVRKQVGSRKYSPLLFVDGIEFVGHHQSKTSENNPIHSNVP